MEFDKNDFQVFQEKQVENIRKKVKYSVKYNENKYIKKEEVFYVTENIIKLWLFKQYSMVLKFK